MSLKRTKTLLTIWKHVFLAEKIIDNKFKVDKKAIINSVFLANGFNTFYINIGTNLASKIPLSNTYIDPTTYIKKDHGNSLYLKPLLGNWEIQILDMMVLLLT